MEVGIRVGGMWGWGSPGARELWGVLGLGEPSGMGGGLGLGVPEDRGVPEGWSLG